MRIMGNIRFVDVDETNEHIAKTVKLKSGQEKFIEDVDGCLHDAKNYE